MALASETAERAFNLDPTSVYAARSLSLIYLFTHRIDDAVAILEPLLKSNPGNDSVVMRLGDVYTYAGQPQRGIDLMLGVYQRDPRYPGVGHAFIGRGFLLLNRHAEAIAELKTCVLRVPLARVCREVAAVGYAEMGKLDEARVEAMEAHRLDPEFTLLSAPAVLPFKNLKDLQRFLDGLRKAGLPER
jgi:tetratricopeptide (TPR) repeat protein